MAIWDLFKKKKSMEKIQEGDLKTKDFITKDLSNFKFQKLSGGRATKMLKVEEKNGKMIIHFADGTSTDFKLIEESYIRLSMNQPDFSQEQVKQLIDSRRKKAKVSAGPAPILPGEEGFIEEASKGAGNVSDVTISPIVATRPESPLQQLLKKQKENLVSINLNLKINLPPKALFDVLLESYENGEDEILNFAVSKVDIESIKLSIKEAIKKNYYKTNGSSDGGPK